MTLQTSFFSCFFIRFNVIKFSLRSFTSENKVRDISYIEKKTHQTSESKQPSLLIDDENLIFLNKVLFINKNLF